MGLDARNPVLGDANNTGVDQPAHPRSLISAFLFAFWKVSLCKLAAGEISIFKLVSIAEETGLTHSLSNPPPPPPQDRFSHNEAHMIPI